MTQITRASNSTIKDRSKCCKMLLHTLRGSQDDKIIIRLNRCKPTKTRVMLKLIDTKESSIIWGLKFNNKIHIHLLLKRN